MDKEENKDYLSKQILTYIGNKRGLLDEIESEVVFVCEQLNKDKLFTLDLFSGSGIVARLLKKYSHTIIANDLESYSKILNDCFLSNKKDFDEKIFNHYLKQINDKIKDEPIKGIIRENYSPVDDKRITQDDRAFYTNENATYIDSFRYYIDKIVPKEYRKYFLALLLIESSIHVNTCGVFKGFYKDPDSKIGKFGGRSGNALSRIKGKIKIQAPYLSNFESNYKIYQEDANQLVKKLKGLDFTYLDPPYNQHPYGSNYFMLNLIIDNQKKDNTSKVSGIPEDWNHSIFNVKQKALNGLKEIIENLDSKYILVSYNNEGFIGFDEMKNMLEQFGPIKIKRIAYHTFRGSRNLRERDIYTKEYLFLLKKER